MFMKNIPLSTQVSILRRLKAETLQAQLEYGVSKVGFETARNIIATKIRNSRALLTNYRQARYRKESPISIVLLETQANLNSVLESMSKVSTKQSLFLLEAKAARVYLQAVSIICHQENTWHRVYPGGEDALNYLLNVGYSILARHCRETLVQVGLLPQLGILHGQNSIEPLVYDFSEVFRQASVDAVLLPFFTRKRSTTVRLPGSDMSSAMIALHHRYKIPFLYKGRCVRLEIIMHDEAVRLRQAICDNQPWQPYQHSWRHGKACR